MHRYLDLVWLDGMSPVKALEAVGSTGSDLIAWRKDERWRSAYQERQSLVRSMAIDRAMVSMVASLHRKSSADELDGHALVQGVGRLAELSNWDPQSEQSAAPVTGLPALNNIFSPVLASENGKKPAKPGVNVVKKDSKGTKKGKGGGKGGC